MRNLLRHLVVPVVVCLQLCVPAARGEHYAVLFSGGGDPDHNHKRYYDNTLSMYNTLIYQWHYLPENVIVIAADGDAGGLDQNLEQSSPDDETPDLIDSDWNVLDPATTILSATAANLETTLNGLPLTSRSTLLLWTYDHGSGDENVPGMLGEEELNGWGEDIADETLSGYCQPLAAGRQAYVFSQCYAGGMLERLEIDAGVGSDPGKFGCAAANHYENSIWDSGSTPHGFVDAFTEGMNNGLTRTFELYEHAYNNTPAATGGEGPDGAWAGDVQHPWMIGEDFDLPVAEWMGWQNGSWTDPDNWSDGLETDADRTVRIRMDGSPNFPATIQTSESARHVLVWSTGELHVASPGSLHLAGDLQNDGGIVTVTGATLEIDGDLDNTEAASHVGAGNAAAVVVHGGAINAGDIGVHTGSEMDIYGSLENRAGATVTVEDAATRLEVWYDCQAAGAIDVGGGAVLLVDNILYVGTDAGTGQVNVTDGWLDVNNQLRIGVADRGRVIAHRSGIEVHSLVSVGQADHGELQLYGSGLRSMYVYVGQESGSEGQLYLEMDGASAPYVKVGGVTFPKVVIGDEAAGTVFHNAGALTRFDPDVETPFPPYPEVVLGNDQEGVGVYNFGHGEIHAEDMTVGNDGTGTLSQWGGDAKIRDQFSMAAGPMAKGTYHMSDGSLTAERFEVARNGEGKVTQTGGLVTVNNLLRLATQAGSNGKYDLNGGTLRANLIYGGSGIGRLRVDGGTLELTGTSIWDVYEFAVGYAAGSVGNLDLTGKDLSAYYVYVGRDGTGTFTMTGGTTAATQQLIIGYAGTGDMKQTAGDTDASWMYLGLHATGVGTYALEGGNLIVSNTLYAGYEGNDSLLVQKAGTTLEADAAIVGHTGRNNRYRQEGGDATVTTSLTLGQAAGGEGIWELAGGWLRSDRTIVGHAGDGSIQQTGGEHKVIGVMTLGLTAGATGRYELDAGIVKTAGTVVGDGGTGTFQQTGGTHEVTGDLEIGRSGNTSSYTLSGLPISCRLQAQNETVGQGAMATFTQTGGANEVSGNLYLGSGVGGHGTYYYHGGILAVNGDIAIGSGGGTGVLDMDGTTLGKPAGAVAISAGSTLRGYGTVQKAVQNDGTVYVESGVLALQRVYLGAGDISTEAPGTLDLQADAVVSGSVSNSGVLRVSGGTTQLLGGLTSGPAGHIEVAGGAILEASCEVGTHTAGIAGTVRQFSGKTTVDDALDMDGSYILGPPAELESNTADVAGTFIHDDGIHAADGLYISAAIGVARYNVHGGSLEAGTLRIGMDAGGVAGAGELNITNASAYVAVSQMLDIHNGGAVHAVPGATIHMTGSAFRNYSETPRACADLWQVELVFEGGPAVLDTFEVGGGPLDWPGGEKDKSGGGPIGSFAIGTLHLGGSAGVGRLQLVDLVENCPGWGDDERLYVGSLILGPGSSLDLNGLDVYYLHLANRGGSIDLNGGQLVLVPEPSSSALCAIALVGVLRRRQRFGKRGGQRGNV